MMTHDEAIKHLDTGIRQDRERLLSFADALYFQPKHQDRLDEIEDAKQRLRDITKLPDYPNIDYPILLPDCFPNYGLVTIVKDTSIEELTSYPKNESFNEASEQGND